MSFSYLFRTWLAQETCTKRKEEITYLTHVIENNSINFLEGEIIAYVGFNFKKFPT